MAIENNMIVSIEYEVRDSATKDLIDSNIGHKPLSFMTGKSQIISGLENHVKTMSEGEKADVLVKAADAYGEYDPQAVQSLPREQFAGIDLYEGMTLYGQGEDGSTVQVQVASFNDDEVVIDFNHPLAGKDLMFTVTVTEVREPTLEESMTGQVIDKSSAGGCCGSCGCG